LPDALAAAGFTDVPEAVKTVDRLVHGPGFGHVSQRTQELFGSLFPTVLEWARKVAEPDKALARLEKFTNAYGSRGLLYEVLASHPRLVEMLMRLGDASGFLSETIVRRPELFDEVCRGVTLNEPKSRERLLEEVRTLAEKSDQPMEQARRWKQAELLRIGLEDVLGLVDLEQVHHEITWLAGSCLRFSVEMARRDLKMEKFPFAVIAMGKYGGQELGYGADLDVLFVGGRDGGDQAQACRLATVVMRLMTEQTAAGTLFPVDPRLRPDGEKGPLASALPAHRDYYRERAMLWERQALTKARWVAGEETLGRKFMVVAHEAAFERGLSDEELGQIVNMRRRIEMERGDQAHREWEFKTGPGGLVDVEFLVQALQMRHGRDHEPVRTSHTLSALNRLTAAGIVEDELSYDLRRGYLFLRKIESVLRRMENTSVSRLPSAEKDRLALARRMGFGTLADFERAYAGMTGRIRAVFEHLMSC
jgi:glutamate-ammonia-ligase adenylyltransferase